MFTTTRRRAPSRSWRFRLCATSATSYGPSSTPSTSPTCSQDGRRPARSASRPASMPPPEDSAQPRLAAGCRWGGTEENRVMLYPEGALRLRDTGLLILERCDGEHSFGQIIAELQAQFANADPAKIRADISQFL